MRPLLVLTLLVLPACGDEAPAPDASRAPSPPPWAQDAPEPAPEDPEAHVEGEVGVRELAGGLVVETVAGGKGHAAVNGDRLRIHYEGRIQESGEVFGSTYDNGIPYDFVLGQREVIQAWELALRGARPGADLKLAVPAPLAYAERGMGKVPPDAALEFDIHVVSIQRP